MGRLRKTRNLNARTPVWFRLLAGVSSIALPVFVAVAIAATAVHADVRVPDSSPVAHRSSPAAAPPPFTFGPRLAPESHFAEPGHALAAWFRGIASWYGEQFNGRLTASGKPFDMYAMTAATTEFQPRLPLGATVRVTDRRSRRSVVVRIDDCGPLPPGRVLDLSYGAARRLKMVDRGIAHVQVHVLSWGKDRDR